MSEMTTIGLILFAVGIIMILSGIIMSYLERNKEEKSPQPDGTPPEQSKTPSPKNVVLHKMQHDEKLKVKILEEIEKKSK